MQPNEASNDAGPPAADPQWSTKQRLDAPVCRRSDVRANVRDHRPDLTDCYRSAVRRNRRSRGNLKVRWRIDGNGDVETVEFVTDELEDEKLRRCVASVVRSFDFPPPRGGETCTFVYPFRFAPSSNASTSHPDSSTSRREESP